MTSIKNLTFYIFFHLITERNFGVMYETGRGVMVDYNQALKWFTKAAAQGNSFAQYKLGRIYERGLGVKKDLVEAYHWYWLSSQQGDEEATESLNRLKTVLTKSQINEAMNRISGSKKVDHE